MRLSEAQKREMLIAYQKTIYNGFREVSDALVGYDRTREQRSQQDQLVQALAETTRLSNLRYQGGAGQLPAGARRRAQPVSGPTGAGATAAAGIARPSCSSTAPWAAAGNRAAANARWVAAKQFQFDTMRAVQNTRMEPPMKAIELTGDIDEQHRLRAQVPEELPVGPVRLIVLLPDEDDAGAAWAHGLTRDWAEELRDPRQDIYTLEDGQPIDAAR